MCQDHAQVLLALVRRRGIPAGYVSGYLLPDDDGMPHEAAQASGELHVPGLGGSALIGPMIAARMTAMCGWAQDLTRGTRH